MLRVYLECLPLGYTLASDLWGRGSQISVFVCTLSIFGLWGPDLWFILGSGFRWGLGAVHLWLWRVWTTLLAPYMVYLIPITVLVALYAFFLLKQRWTLSSADVSRCCFLNPNGCCPLLQWGGSTRWSRPRPRWRWTSGGRTTTCWGPTWSTTSRRRWSRASRPTRPSGRPWMRSSTTAVRYTSITSTHLYYAYILYIYLIFYMDYIL